MAISIVSQDEAGEADFIICMLAPVGRPLLMAGNVFGLCKQCDRRVQHRPHIPVGPKLLCNECHRPDIADDVVITPATLAEVLRRVRSH